MWDGSHLRKPRRSSTSGSRGGSRCRDRCQSRAEAKTSFYVTTGVLLETGNHISRIPDGAVRTDFARKLAADASSSVDKNGGPWVIVAGEDPPGFVALLDRWSSSARPQDFGPIDAAVAEAAAGLKKRYASWHPDLVVHIWTLDRDLKAAEPDAERKPIVGY